jgi:hypothetical protein
MGTAVPQASVGRLTLADGLRTTRACTISFAPLLAKQGEDSVVGLADRFRLIAWNAPGYLLSDNLRAETPS